jgi:hypothetical protein
MVRGCEGVSDPRAAPYDNKQIRVEESNLLCAQKKRKKWTQPGIEPFERFSESGDKVAVYDIMAIDWGAQTRPNRGQR